MKILKKLKSIRKFILSVPYSICFNFKHLPFNQAIKLPIIICNSRISGKGQYKIEGKIETGMIRLGFPMVSIFKGKGIIIENNGSLIFKGQTKIGANSGISIGPTGKFVIGNEFVATYGLKVVCYNEIIMGEKNIIGWEGLLCDTDLHSLKSEDGTKRTKGYGAIKTGDDVWIGAFCKLLKNSEIPYKCTVAANTLVNKKIECKPFSLIYSGAGIKVKHTGYYRDINDDQIDYSLP